MDGYSRWDYLEYDGVKGRSEMELENVNQYQLKLTTEDIAKLVDILRAVAHEQYPPKTLLVFAEELLSVLGY